MRSLRCPFGGCERQSNERLDELSLIRNHRISVPRLDAALARGAGPQIRDRRDIRVDRDLSMTIRARGNDLKGTPGTSKIFHGEICGAARTLRHTVLVSDLSWYVNNGLWTGPSVVCMSGPSAGRRALKRVARDPTATGSTVRRTHSQAGTSNRRRLSPPDERPGGLPSRHRRGQHRRLAGRHGLGRTLSSDHRSPPRSTGLLRPSPATVPGALAPSRPGCARARSRAQQCRELGELPARPARLP